MQKVKENPSIIISTCIIHPKKDFIPPFPLFISTLPPLSLPQLFLYIYETLEKKSIQLDARITDLSLSLLFYGTLRYT